MHANNNKSFRASDRNESKTKNLFSAGSRTTKLQHMGTRTGEWIKYCDGHANGIVATVTSRMCIYNWRFVRLHACKVKCFQFISMDTALESAPAVQCGRISIYTLKMHFSAQRVWAIKIVESKLKANDAIMTFDGIRYFECLFGLMRVVLKCSCKC